jgi:hypothetical protein
MRRIPGLRLALFLSVLGCQARGPLPVAPLPISPLPALTQDLRLSGASDATAPVLDGRHERGVPGMALPARTASLRFTVRWPPRSTQLLPGRTQALRVVVRDETDGTEHASTLLRSEGEPELEFFKSLPADRSYTIRAVALSSGEADAIVLAESAPRVPIFLAWNTRTDVRLDMVPGFVPQIVTSSGGAGGAGALLSFTGTNLGTGEAWFTFPGGQRSRGTWTGERLEVSVPPGAGSGPLGLTVDRVPATSSFRFQFQELVQLAVRGVATDGVDRNGGEAIESWPGDRFALVASGRDASGSVVDTPAHTTLTTSTSGTGNLSAQGEYEAFGLGRDEVTVRSGNVVSTRSILVAPPAGPTWRPTAPVASSNPVQDLSLIRVKDRFLAAWFQQGVGLCWQFLTLAGEPTGVVHRSDVVGGSSDDRIVRLAAWGDWVVLAVRLPTQYSVNKINKLVVIMLMDPRTGQLVWDNAANRPRLFVASPFVLGNQYLDNLVAGEQGLLLSLFSLHPSFGWQHQIASFTPQATGDVSWRTAFLYPSSSGSESVKGPTQDHLAIAPTPRGFVWTETYEHPSGTVVRKSFVDPLGQNSTASTFVDMMPEGRNLAIASADGGKTHLIAGLSVRQGRSWLQTYRIDENLGKDVNSQRMHDSWNDSFPGSLGEPVTLVWNGFRYIVSYVKRVPDPANSAAMLSQPMVMALDTKGDAASLPHAAAPAGKSPTILATPEGALAAWVDGSGRLAVRRMRFHAAP